MRRALPFLLVLALPLAGCGGSDRTHGGERATPTPSAGTPAPVVEETP